MSAPQIIRTPGGEELVVLPRTEYEALVHRADQATKDAGDVANMMLERPNWLPAALCRHQKRQPRFSAGRPG